MRRALYYGMSTGLAAFITNLPVPAMTAQNP